VSPWQEPVFAVSTIIISAINSLSAVTNGHCNNKQWRKKGLFFLDISANQHFQLVPYLYMRQISHCARLVCVANDYDILRDLPC
jgi:hypothetical protein